LRSLNCDPPR